MADNHCDRPQRRIAATVVSKSVSTKLQSLLSERSRTASQEVNALDYRPSPLSNESSTVALTRPQRRHMLCQLIAEAARYQRSFFRDTHSRAKLRAMRSQSAVPGGQSARSYMLLSEQSALDLLNDVKLLMHDALETDYTRDVAKQLFGLLLFQPSGFEPSSSNSRRRVANRRSQKM